MGDKEQEVEPLLGCGAASSPLPTLPSLPTLHHAVPHLSMVFAVACIVDQFGVNPIIVLPRAIILCGWFGFPLALSVFALTIYTAMLLGRCWVMAEHIDGTMAEKNRYPYTALTEMAWGRTAAKFVNVFLNIAVFTSNIPALLIASQNLQTFDARVSNYTFNFSYCYWLIILGLAVCPLTWLGSPKDLKWISVTSACAVLTTAFLTWVCMFWDDTRAFVFRDIPSFNWQSVAIAYGILAFQLGCHPAILAIQADMHNKRQLSQSILGSFFVTGGLFMITTCLAAMLYGAGVRANLTQGLPATLALFTDILVITVQLFLSTVVGGCALFQDLEDKLNIPRELCWQRCVLRSLLVMLAVLVAEVLPRFDLVMGLLGGLLTGPITFVFPPLLYTKLRAMSAASQPLHRHTAPPAESPGKQRESPHLKHRMAHFFRTHFFSLDVNLAEGKLSAAESVVMTTIVVLGISATVTATFYSLRGAVWSAKFIPPCLFNVKAASNIINT